MYYLGNVKFIVLNNSITVKSISASFGSNQLLFLVIVVWNKTSDCLYTYLFYWDKVRNEFNNGSQVPFLRI